MKTQKDRQWLFCFTMLATGSALHQMAGITDTGNHLFQLLHLHPYPSNHPFQRHPVSESKASNRSCPQLRLGGRNTSLLQVTFTDSTQFHFHPTRNHIWVSQKAGVHFLQKCHSYWIWIIFIMTISVRQGLGDLHHIVTSERIWEWMANIPKKMYWQKTKTLAYIYTI